MNDRIVYEEGITIQRQIKDDVIARIKNETWKVGEQIPTENDLAGTYGVSRMTIRAALGSLVRDGLLQRKKGVGTFVAAKHFVRNQQYLLGLFEEMTSQGYTVRSSVLSLRPISSESIPEEIRPAPVGQVFLLRRLRHVDDIPMVLDDTYMGAEVARKISSKDLEDQSLYQVLESEGVGINYAEKVIDAIIADTETAELLQCEVGDLLFLMINRIFSNNANVIMISKLRIRGGGLYQIKITSKRKHSRTGAPTPRSDK